MSGEGNEPRALEIEVLGEKGGDLYIDNPTTNVDTSPYYNDIIGYCTATQINASNFTMYYDWYNNNISILSGNLEEGNYSGIQQNFTLSSSYISAGDNIIFSCFANNSASTVPSWTNSTPVSIVNYYINNCSGGTGISTNATTINFNLFNENELTNINANITGTVTYSHDNATFSNYTFSYHDVSNFSLCIYPSSTNLYSNWYLKHKKTYDQRYYLVDLALNNETQTVYMYNFEDDTDISILTGIVKNEEYSAMSDIYVKLERYYSEENLWRTVQVDKTDEFGKVIFYVIQNSEDYRFIFNRQTTQIDKTNSVKFSCDTATECEQTFVLYEFGTEDKFDGMLGNITQTGDLFILRWNDPRNTASSVYFLVEKQEIGGVVEICNLSATASSGSLICNISGYDGFISARAFRSASPFSVWLSTFYETVGVAITDFLDSNDGVFFSSLILMVAIGFGAATGSGIAVILTGVFGGILVSLLDLTSVFSAGMIVSTVVIGILLMFLVKK